jgi:hypothetical protein
MIVILSFIAYFIFDSKTVYVESLNINIKDKNRIMDDFTKIKKKINADFVYIINFQVGFLENGEVGDMLYRIKTLPTNEVYEISYSSSKKNKDRDNDKYIIKKGRATSAESTRHVVVEETFFKAFTLFSEMELPKNGSNFRIQGRGYKGSFESYKNQKYKIINNTITEITKEDVSSLIGYSFTFYSEGKSVRTLIYNSEDVN